MGKKKIGKKGGSSAETHVEEVGSGSVNASVVSRISSTADVKNQKIKKAHVDGIKSNAAHSEAVIIDDVVADRSDKKKDLKKKRNLEHYVDGKESHKAKKKNKRDEDGDSTKIMKSSKEIHVDREDNVISGNNNQNGLAHNSDLETDVACENLGHGERVQTVDMRNIHGKRESDKEKKKKKYKQENGNAIVGDDATESFPRQEDVIKAVHKGESDQKKEKKKNDKHKQRGVVTVEGSITDRNEVIGESETVEGEVLKKTKDSRKEKKRKKKNYDDNLYDEQLGEERSVIKCEQSVRSGDKEDSSGNQTSGTIAGTNNVVEDDNKDKKKRKKNVKSGGPEVKGDTHVARNRSSRIIGQSENPTPSEKSRKVSFSDNVEVFHLSDGTSDAGKGGEKGLVRGKRFSKEEDEIIRKAVSKYVEDHGLGENGLEMVLHCHAYKKIKNVWKEIGAAIPWRPLESVYYRAHILFERGEKRKWTTEEYDLVRKYVEKVGPKWRTLGDALGKHRLHVKDTWRRIKMNRNRGQWSQNEYQTLFDLVNLDLRMKAYEEKKSKHGMLRDNICWETISDKLVSRPYDACCHKWYNQLASPMVAAGEWADADDYRLLDALSSIDACCMEDVDWDKLIEHRSGDICRRRWDQMVRHIGHHRNETFAEQVEILSKRYCPDLLEAREAYDSNPEAGLKN